MTHMPQIDTYHKLKTNVHVQIEYQYFHFLFSMFSNIQFLHAASVIIYVVAQQQLLCTGSYERGE